MIKRITQAYHRLNYAVDRDAFKKVWLVIHSVIFITMGILLGHYLTMLLISGCKTLLSK